ncbi:MAG: hypothetical protein ACRC1D_00855, partial [Culicoidibacterales bacterium]
MIDWLGSVSPKTLAILTKSDDHYMRQRVATYAKTSPELLKILAKDTVHLIQVAVAKNPQTAPAVLTSLFLTDNRDLQTAVLQNSGLTTEQLVEFWEKLPIELQPFALAHPNFPL